MARRWNRGEQRAAFEKALKRVAIARGWEEKRPGTVEKRLLDITWQYRHLNRPASYRERGAGGGKKGKPGRAGSGDSVFMEKKNAEESPLDKLAKQQEEERERSMKAQAEQQKKAAAERGEEKEK